MGCEDVFHLVRTDETYLFCLIMVFEVNFHLNFHLVREDVFTLVICLIMVCEDVFHLVSMDFLPGARRCSYLGECKCVSSWCVRMFFTW